MQAGDKVFEAFAAIDSLGNARSWVRPLDVLVVVDGIAVFAENGRAVTPSIVAKVFETEAEAWAHCAGELAQCRASIDAALAEANAKAAAGRVGEAVPA
jgi:hypothetical protein